jgi:hypothetical protein
MIHNHWLRITRHYSQPLDQQMSQLLWIVVCYDEPVVVYHGVLCWTNGCESSCFMLSQLLYRLAQNNTTWFTITGSVSHTMIHNHWHSITHHDSQTLIIASYADPVVVNHGVLSCASGCESWCVMPSHSLWIMVCHAERVVVNHGVLCCRITHSDSGPLVLHNTIWFTTTGTA